MADENVIFDNQQTVDPNDPNAQPQDAGQAVQEGDGGEGVPPADGGEGEPTDEEYVEPPPSPIARLLAHKKILIGVGVFIVLFIIILLLLPKGQKAKDVTLEWWGLWEDKATMQPIIDDFEKQNPRIKIIYTKQDHDNYRDTLLTRINKGTGPDIFRYHNTWVSPMSKIIAPLPTDVISVTDFTKAYYPVIQSDLIQNGAIYGIPLGVDSIALFINTDLLRAAGLSVPEDWNQFVSAAKNLTVRDKDTKNIQVAGAALGTYANINHAQDIISIMFLQQGVDLKKIYLSKDNLIAAMQFYTAFSKNDTAVWESGMDNSLIEFSRGNVAMYFGFSYDIFSIEHNKNTKLKYSIYPVPSLDKGKSVTVASYWVEGVSSRSKNQKEAMLFMKYLTQKETLQKLYTEASKTRLFGEPYPRVDMADELKDNKMVAPFISQMNTAGSSYFASGTHDGDTGLNKRANVYLENVVNVLSKNISSVEGEVKKLQEGVAAILVENGIQ